MKTFRETTALIHRTIPPGGGLPEADLRRVLGWLRGIVKDLDRIHRERRWHGDIGPDAVRIRGNRARLLTTVRSSPPEFRDPERERLRLMRDVRDPDCEARQDVYGVGALLYLALENGPPPCGAFSALTRPAPSAVAWIVGRALAEGDARYPTADAMRSDLDRLLSARGSLDDVAPEDLPSWAPGEMPLPRRLVPYRVAARRERRGTFALVVLALVAVVALAVGFAVTDVDADPSDPPSAAVVAGAKTPSLPDLVEAWRARLTERLAAAGESFEDAAVPLLVVSDVSLARGPDWLRRYSSSRLANEVRHAMEAGASPAEVDDLLRSRAGRSALPAVLRVRSGLEPGTLDVSLDYRGVRYVGVATSR